jgi:pimeloyl-ACP methyl ester carboxylesterase
MAQTTFPSQGGSPAGRRTRHPPTSPLDRSDPGVQAARQAERRVYEHYGCEYIEHFVDVDGLGLRMRVVEIGTGSPLVLITGGNGVGLEWAPLVPELAGHTLYIMDRPGAGFSDGFDHRSMSFTHQAITATKALFDHFGLDSAPIVGNSIGGNWAIRFTVHYPERVSSLCLLGCPAMYPETSAPVPLRLGSVPLVGGFLFERFIQADDATGSRGNWEFLGQSAETVERLPEAFAEGWYRMQNLPHAKVAWVSLLQTVTRIRGAQPSVALTPDELRNVSAPVLLVWGRDDTFGAIENGRRGVKWFQDVEFHEVGSGHLPWLDEPERCGELIVEFVARNG